MTPDDAAGRLHGGPDEPENERAARRLRLEEAKEQEREQMHREELKTQRDEIEALQQQLETMKTHKQLEEKTMKVTEPRTKFLAPFKNNFRCPQLKSLKGNYNVWQMNIRNLLAQHEQSGMNMWTDVVNKKPTDTNKMDITWCDMDNQARMIISQTIAENLMIRMDRYVHANEWWTALQPPNTLEAANLAVFEMKKKRLHQFRSLDEYLTSMEESRGNILGFPSGPALLDEQSYLLAILLGTNDNPHYEPARTQLYQLYDNEPLKFTFDEITKRLSAQSIRMGTRRGRSPPTANQTTTYDKETRRPKYKNKKYDDRKPNNNNQDWIKTATCHGCGHLLRDCRSSKQNNKKTFQAENKKAFQAKTKTENDKEEYYLSFFAATPEEQRKETPQTEEKDPESARGTIPERELPDTQATRGSQPDGTNHLGEFRMREGELFAGTGEDSQGNQNSQHSMQTQPATPVQGIDSNLVCTYSRWTDDDSQGNQYSQHRLQT